MEEMAQPETAINTRSGRVLDFANPRVEAIELDDIAAGLASVPRFGAQALRFYSVAQHAVSVALIVERLGRDDLALAALHHDSHEAYACDIPRPLKGLLEPQYSRITEALDNVIADALGLEPPAEKSQDARLIKAVDDAAFIVEAEDLLDGAPALPAAEREIMRTANAVIDLREQWSFEAARSSFHRTHESLAPSRGPLRRPSHP